MNSNVENILTLFLASSGKSSSIKSSIYLLYGNLANLILLFLPFSFLSSYSLSRISHRKESYDLFSRFASLISSARFLIVYGSLSSFARIFIHSFISRSNKRMRMGSGPA